MSKSLFTLSLLALCFNLFAQKNEKLKIFIDCNQEWLCDMDFLRKELSAVDFVRDRFLCEVQIISNVQFNGNGGESNTLSFIGQKEFASKRDTFTYFNELTATDDVKRKKMLKHLQVGLIPFLLQKGSIDNIDVTLKTDSTSNSQPVKDPYNLFQFSFGSSGSFNGDRNYSYSNINNNILVSRETTQSKFTFEVYNSLSRNKFNFYNADTDSTEVVTANRDRQDVFTQYVKKVNEHWAYGMQFFYTRSVFENIDHRLRITPTVEYSIFPYTKFNDTRLIVGYSIGPRFLNYGDTTIYFKIKETLVQQNINAIASFTKQWGTINLGAFWSNYMDDFKKNNFSLGGAISWNVFKGFKFSVGGSYDLIHDQISLPKYDATRDDLLTQRRIIATSFNYWCGVGFSYTFGSIYNSQVHPTNRGLSYSLNF